MKISPNNILFHECIGLTTTVVRASDKSLEGVQGRIRDETKNTFIVQVSPDKSIVIPKSVATFLFDVGSVVTVEGRDLIGDSGSRISRLR